MKKKIKELRAKITEYLARMDELHQLTITEERKLSEEEQLEYDGLKVKVSEVNEEITELEEAEEERLARATELAAERERNERPIREITPCYHHIDDVRVNNRTGTRTRNSYCLFQIFSDSIYLHGSGRLCPSPRKMEMLRLILPIT